MFNLCFFKQSGGITNLLSLGADGNAAGATYKGPKTKFANLPVCTAFEAATLSGAGEAVAVFLASDEERFKPMLLNPPNGWNPKAWKPIENIPLLCTGVTVASSPGAVAFAQMAITYSVPLNEPYVDGCSLAMMMTALGHAQAAVCLINSGKTIDYKLKDIFDRGIVWYAAYACDHDRTAILKAALKQGADANSPDKFGVTPILAAARSGSANSVALLMNKNFTYCTPTVANPKYRHPGKKGIKKSPLVTGIARRKSMSKIDPQSNSSLVPMIMSGQTIGKFEVDGNMAKIPLPPYKAGSWACVEGATLNATDDLGYTALWYAVLNKNADMVRMLIADPAVDVNIQNKDGVGGNEMTPLMLSACVKARGKLDIFLILLSHPKIDLHISNSQGLTVFDIAFMEEIEFVNRPMTALLKTKGMEFSQSIAKDAAMFEAHDAVSWAKAVPAQAKIVEKLGEDKRPNAGEIWKRLQGKTKYYEDAYWLRSVTKYDHSGNQEMKREKVRQRTITAKQVGFVAAAVSAKAAGYMMGGGGDTMVAAVNYGRNVWRSNRGNMLRNYDMEYHLARQEKLGSSLAELPDKELMARMHIPEDYNLQRHHVDRQHNLSASKAWKTHIKETGLADDKGKFQKVRWVRKVKTIKFVADGSG